MSHSANSNNSQTQSAGSESKAEANDSKGEGKEEKALVPVPPKAVTVREGPYEPKNAGGISPIIQNVVATCNLGCKLDLKQINMRARNSEYNPKRFAAIIMRIREPKTTALVFSSGKIVVTGARTEKLAHLAARKYARIIQKLGFKDVAFKEFKIQNIVGSCDVKFPVRLEGLAYKHEDFSSYEPELFPGLIYRMVNPKVVLLVFVSGKVVLTGAKSRDDIFEAFDLIYPVLLNFKKDAGDRMESVEATE